MKQLWFVFPFLMVAASCLAGDVPGLTVSDFAGDTSPLANAIWTILAGQGPWGVLLFAILGVVWKFASPYLNEWAAQKKLDRLFEAVRAGVGGTLQTYVDAIKEANADGKLTEEEVKIARDKCRAFVIAFLKAQGIDVIRDYGHDVLDWLIEYVLRQMKLDNALAKAVVAPLPDLAP